jgi:hypothetical protein
MWGSIVARVLAVVLLVLVLVGIGTAVYNAGVSAGLTEAAVQAAASGDPVAVPPYGWGYGAGPYAHGPWGFGFFGFLFGIFMIFLLIGLLRFAFGGWGRRHGGPGPGNGWGGRREMIEEMHRDLHRRDAASSGPQAGGTQASNA